MDVYVLFKDGRENCSQDVNVEETSFEISQGRKFIKAGNLVVNMDEVLFIEFYRNRHRLPCGNS